LAPQCRYRARRVAQRLGLSLSQFERRCLTEHQVPPQLFLDALRLPAAAAMLEQKRVVKVVALELNYIGHYFRGVWTATGSLTIPRADFTATLLANGQVLATGGDNGGGYLSESELYDP